MEKVLVLVFSNLKHDARVNRQVNWLLKRYRVTLVCFDADEYPNVTVIRINQTKLTLLRKALLTMALIARFYKLAYHIFHQYDFLKDRLADQEFSLVVANDIDTLPLAFKLAGKAKVVFDAHEYAPRHFENNRTWKFLFQPFYIKLCKDYIPRAAGMMTVGQGLATEYEKNFGVKPVIITNATRYFDISPGEVGEAKIRLIHHGIINPSRRLELMMEMMAHLDERFTLDLILMTSDYASAQTRAYIADFKNKVAKDSRVRVLPSVKSNDVVQTINQYDIGVFLIPPVNFNYANTLPNKLFDFIQARLGIAIGPTPEMAGIVNKYQNGVVAESFDPRTLASRLNALKAEDVVRFKVNSSIAATQLNAEKNEEIFNQLLDNIKP